MRLRYLFQFALILVSFSVFAKDTYILGNGQVVALQNIDSVRGTAFYYDFENNKRIYIDLKDASPAVPSVKNTRAGDYVVAQTKIGEQICKVFHTFANGKISFGCQGRKFSTFEAKDILVYAHYSDSINNLLEESKEADGFKMGEVVRLKGQKYKIRAIFENGQVLMDKVILGFAGRESGALLLYEDTKLVSTRDITKL